MLVSFAVAENSAQRAGTAVDALPAMVPVSSGSSAMAGGTAADGLGFHGENSLGVSCMTRADGWAVVVN